MLTFQTWLKWSDKRQQAYAYLCSIKEITVRREQIVETVLDAYRADLQLHHHKLLVVLEGEAALDMEGVTKEIFTLFF